MRTRRKQAGFSLVELAVVTVAISILATTAIPKYLGVQEDSKRAAASGLAGALGSASTTNYLIRSGKGAGTPIANCVDVAGLMLPGSMAGFTISSKPLAAGELGTCTVDHAVPGSSTAATFVAHGIS